MQPLLIRDIFVAYYSEFYYSGIVQLGVHRIVEIRKIARKAAVHHACNELAVLVIEIFHVQIVTPLPAARENCTEKKYENNGKCNREEKGALVPDIVPEACHEIRRNYLRVHVSPSFNFAPVRFRNTSSRSELRMSTSLYCTPFSLR